MGTSRGSCSSSGPGHPFQQLDLPLMYPHQRSTGLSPAHFHAPAHFHEPGSEAATVFMQVTKAVSAALLSRLRLRCRLSNLEFWLLFHCRWACRQTKQTGSTSLALLVSRSCWLHLTANPCRLLLDHKSADAVGLQLRGMRQPTPFQQFSSCAGGWSQQQQQQQRSRP